MITFFTLEEIDRAIYNKVRLALVAGGFLPDITSFTGPTKAADYAAAKAAISAPPAGHVIEVMGVGYKVTRGEREASHITINRMSNEVGTIGGGPVKQHIPYTDTEGNQKFRKILTPSSTRDLVYEIRLHTNKTARARTVTELIWKEIGSKGYLTTYEDDLQTETDKQFFISSNGDVEDNDNEWMHWVFRFTVQDVWVDPENVILDNIVPLTSVRFTHTLMDKDQDEDNLPEVDPTVISIELKDFNRDCKDQTVVFQSGIKWKLNYSTLFPEHCGEIEIKSIMNEAGTEFINDAGTTKDNNLLTKIVTITFQNAEQGFIILGVSTP